MKATAFYTGLALIGLSIVIAVLWSAHSPSRFQNAIIAINLNEWHCTLEGSVDGGSFMPGFGVFFPIKTVHEVECFQWTKNGHDN